jgi:hypothetical protein
MRATELRIGNYVYGINRRSEIHLPDTIPLKVLQIELFNTEVLPLDQNPATVEKWFKITNEDLSPILLTEEWLKKFGFFEKYKSVHSQWSLNGFAVQQTSDQDDDGNTIPQEEVFYYEWNFEVKHVHQLQNLYFALTGEELIIK